MSERYRLLVRRNGGPEVIECEPIGALEPEPGQVLIRHEAIGLNFIDTYYRSGLYTVALPSGIGSEAAGIVERVGRGVESIQEGSRVGYFTGSLGAYATHRCIAADHVVPLPHDIDSESAAALMLKGCTAEYLIERCARVHAGQTVLVHAAAGGVGSILLPWLKAIGAFVIAHSGSQEKAALAKAAGADESLSCPIDALAEQVRALTGGRGVDAVLDGVGAASWQASLASTAQRGILVTYGNASGPVPPFTARDLQAAGSIFVTRPTLGDYTATPDEMRTSAARLFEMVTNRVVTPNIGARFPLSEAVAAHAAIEARATTGSTLLLP